MRNVIILVLIFIATSCSLFRNQSTSKYNQKNQKLLTLTRNLQTSVNHLSCSQKQNWFEVEEQTKRLIWSVVDNNSRLSKAKNILNNLKKAENSHSLAACESLLKTTKYNIKTFEETLLKKKGVNTTQF